MVSCMIKGLSKLNQEKIAALIDRREKLLAKKERQAAERIGAKIEEIMRRGMNSFLVPEKGDMGNG